MMWDVKYLPEAVKDLDQLDGSNQILVRKAIKKVSKNPLSISEGGYGHPLSNKRNTNLAGFMKIKLKSAGLRIVYKIERHEDRMFIVVIGARADEEVYKIADKRIQKHGL